MFAQGSGLSHDWRDNPQAIAITLLAPTTLVFCCRRGRPVMEAIYFRQRLGEEIGRAADATDLRARAAHLGLAEGYLALLEMQREVVSSDASSKIAQEPEATD
jgi:glycerol kinase